jgi:hypothetical protein
MNADDLGNLTDIVEVPIQELSAESMDNLNRAPQAQRRTSRFKKAVKIAGATVFKGPYVNGGDLKRLMNELRYTYAMELLEESMQLEPWQSSSLRWQCVGCSDDDQYYLVGSNVGRWENFPVKMATTKIESKVLVIPRGGHVYRVSDTEKNGLITDDIKLASLQHLYLRFLLYIGDSGTHNILVREDDSRAGRLIAGIDLEEKRAVKLKESRLDHLFKKSPSKQQRFLYQSEIYAIKTISYCELDHQTLERLEIVGIDMGRLKENMDLWERLMYNA